MGVEEIYSHMKPDYQSQPGIVLKKLPYGDADEIITVLLKEEGIRRFFVAGSRKSKKRYQGLVDHFAHLHFYYRPYEKGLWRLHGVEVAQIVSRQIWQELEFFSFASYLAELICEFTPEAVVDHTLYDLWLEMVGGLVEGRRSKVEGLQTYHNCLSVYVFYLIKIFEVTGYALELKQCVRCGSRQLPSLIVFDHLKGGLVCDSCHPGHSDSNISRFSLGLFDVILKRQHKVEKIDQQQGQRFLQELVLFSQCILQKKSRAAGFFLDMVVC